MLGSTLGIPLLTAAPAHGTPRGDTVSPIDISVSASCGLGTINITYRNSWIDGTGPAGVKSLSINGTNVADGSDIINAATENSRIAGISFLRCDSKTSEFIFEVRVDEGDVSRKGIPARHFFSARPGMVKRA